MFVLVSLLNAVYTTQPAVKLVEQPVRQPVECLFTRCIRLFNRLFNRFDNRLDNRLYRVYKYATRCTEFTDIGIQNIINI